MRRRSEKGFSLIEIVITLAIVALALSMGYGAFELYKYRTCARLAGTQFVDDLRFAREQAQVRGTAVAMEWFGNSANMNAPNTYRVFVVDSNQTLKTAGLADVYGPPLHMSPATGQIRFSYRGNRMDLNGVTLASPYSVSFWTTRPLIVKRISVMMTGFSRVQDGS